MQHHTLLGLTQMVFTVACNCIAKKHLRLTPCACGVGGGVGTAGGGGGRYGRNGGKQGGRWVEVPAGERRRG